MSGVCMGEDMAGEGECGGGHDCVGKTRLVRSVGEMTGEGECGEK